MFCNPGGRNPHHIMHFLYAGESFLKNVKYRDQLKFVNYI